MWAHVLDHVFNLGEISSLADRIENSITLTGIELIVIFTFPALLFLEMLFLVWVNRRSPSNFLVAYKLPLLMYCANLVIGVALNLDVFLWTYSFFAKLAPFTVSVHATSFFYAYVVWELGHYVFHWSCHKVRILWCVHAPHHSVQHMNLAVAYAGFFLQGAYATFVRAAVSALFGVPLPLLILVMTIYVSWDELVHVSEKAWPNGKIGGLLGRIILGPSHHRIHHASNPEYIDKNYCSSFPIWDKVFRTLQQEIPDVTLTYGLSGKSRTDFIGTYVSEIALLIQDVRNADSLTTALLYIVMPPGWRPRGDADAAERKITQSPTSVSPRHTAHSDVTSRASQG
jgi:sterol desaturase/sphingolipid hydroxylase (fatty acid hydroxylase superfamily)